jgi:enoyl-CoA hydratase/carnithine racemase
LKEREELNKDARWKYVELVDQALLDVEKIPVPVTAAINGQALGGGTELTLVCDIRLSIADADFGLTETGIGIILKGSIVCLLRDRHDGMNSLPTYTAAHFSTARMAEMKFLHQVVDDVADLQEMALVLAQQIAGNAPLALRAAKIVKLELAAGRASEALQRAEAVRRKLDGTQDCLEELVAFAENRDPEFTDA